MIFETTLASRTFASWLQGLKQKNYIVHLIYLWLHSEDLAIERVAERVRRGGHNIPEAVIRRRYKKACIISLIYTGLLLIPG